MNKIQMIINNLRCRSVSKEEIEAEINFRTENLTVQNEKCFGYTLHELELAFHYWDEYIPVKITY